MDSNLIFYQHEMPDKPFWLAQDAIRFRVVTPTTISDSFILLVLISFEESCPQRLTQLWKNAGKGRMGQSSSSAGLVCLKKTPLCCFPWLICYIRHLKLNPIPSSPSLHQTLTSFH